MKLATSLNCTFSRPLCGRLAVTLAVSALFAFPRLCMGVTFGQIDTFQDGSTDNWGDPAGNSSNISNGGPAGAGDRYMQVVSGSFGGGSHMVTMNNAQWIGDYFGAGVNEITMNIKNFGSSAIPIRIAIREGTGGSATPGYSSTTAYNLVADGQWHSATFLLDAADLTPINNPQPLNTDLQNVADFRLLSSGSPALIGDFISAEIGVDNIHATAVPEPGVLAFAGIAVALGVSRLRNRPK